METPTGLGYDIDFSFVSGETAPQPISTRNKLEMRQEENHCVACLKCKPLVASVRSLSKFQFRETTLFIRSLLLLWGNQSLTVAAPFYDSSEHLLGIIENYRPKAINLLTSEENARKIGKFINLLKERDAKIPFFNLFLANVFNFNECLKKAKSAVKEAEIICMTGGAEQMNKALLLEAQREKKRLCYYLGAKDRSVSFVEFTPKKGRITSA